jgi:trans-2,3-dihydro-3-hydroxyanthranilate isomerase
MEDVATGSAAGCVAAYLLRHGRSQPGEQIALSQGRFLGRSSTIVAAAYGEPHAIDRVEVGAEVTLVSTGTLLSLPPREQS